MPNYRRAFIGGASWFFTVNLRDRTRRLLVDRIGALRVAVRETCQRFPFDIDAMVVLPDHIHAIWTLPEDDSNFPVRWRLIKIRFSRSIPKGEWLSESRRMRGERGIWQRRYWEHLIRDERDLNHHIDYCWFNPVKHGLVANVEDWPYSSFHRDNRGNPRPVDLSGFEKALAEYARTGRSSGYGERSNAQGAISERSERIAPSHARMWCGGIGAMRFAYRTLRPTHGRLTPRTPPSSARHSAEGLAVAPALFASALIVTTRATSWAPAVERIRSMGR
jgi:putative transposase